MDEGRSIRESGKWLGSNAGGRGGGGGGGGGDWWRMVANGGVYGYLRRGGRGWSPRLNDLVSGCFWEEGWGGLVW